MLTHHVDLRFRFTSEIVYEGAYLAIENADMCEIILNGEKAPDGVFGYFTDESIGKRNLPAIREGENELLIRTPIGVRTKVEWCYIMGDFGVRVCGCRKTVTKLPEKLGYSDITSQGLPFYTGNIDYVQPITTPDCLLSVRVSEYRGALVRVFLDGKDMGVIAFDPFTLDFGKVSAGDHSPSASSERDTMPSAHSITLIPRLILSIPVHGVHPAADGAMSTDSDRWG